VVSFLTSDPAPERAREFLAAAVGRDGAGS